VFLKFIIGIGGSATNDGGTGMLIALSMKFRTRNGEDITTVSHVNDGFFGVVTQYSGMKVTDAYKAMTMATWLMGITTIAVTMLLWVVMV
jgi:hypothetical protein